MSGSGNGRFEGDRYVHAGAGLHLASELISDGDAVALCLCDEALKEAVVSIQSCRVEDGHELAELLEKSQGSLGRVGFADANVDTSSTHKAIEAGVEDAMQEGDGIVFQLPQDFVVALDNDQLVIKWL